jgi:hypothetical protein
MAEAEKVITATVEDTGDTGVAGKVVLLQRRLHPQKLLPLRLPLASLIQNSKSATSMRSSRLAAGMVEAEKVVTATAAVGDTGVAGKELLLQRSLHLLKLLPLR